MCISDALKPVFVRVWFEEQVSRYDESKHGWFSLGPSRWLDFSFCASTFLPVIIPNHMDSRDFPPQNVFT